MRLLRAWTTGLLLFAIVLVAGLGVTWAVGAEYQDAPEANYTASETHVADVGNESTVNAPNYTLGFWDNETIVDSQGNTLTEGTDYEWNTSTGTITWLSSPDVDDGETMTVDYAYWAKTQQARTLRALFQVPIGVIIPLSVLIIAGMAVAGLAAGVYALFGGRGGGRRSNSLNFSRR